MAGTSWKAVGSILLVLGVIGVLVGIAAALYGGMVFSDAVSGNGNEAALEVAGELIGVAIYVGGIAFVLGVVLAVVGVVMLVVGARRAQRELLDAMRERPASAE